MSDGVHSGTVCHCRTVCTRAGGVLISPIWDTSQEMIEGLEDQVSIEVEIERPGLTHQPPAGIPPKVRSNRSNGSTWGTPSPPQVRMI